MCIYENIYFTLLLLIGGFFMSDSQSLEIKKHLPILSILLAGAFITILNQTLITTALPPIMKDFDVTQNTVQYLQSTFMLVNGIMIPITAFLIAKFTTRRLFIFAIGIFTFGTLVSAVAPSFSLLLIGRILQGMGAGIMMPLLQTIMFLIFPIEARGRAMGIFGVVIAFAPAIGPSLSGYLVDQFPWRSVFYVVLPIGLIITISAYFVLKNVTEQTDPKLDIPSILLSTLGFGGLLYAFSIAGNVGWFSISVLISGIVGTITLILFIRRQTQLKEPILQFKVFSYRLFSLTTILGMIVFGAMISSTVILPLYMQNLLGFNAFHSGLAMLPGAVVMGLMNPINGSLFDKYGAKWLLRIGLTILTLTTFVFATLTTETTFAYIVTLNALRMFGISMVMMPSTTLGLNQLPNHLIPHGSAMNNTFRQMAGAIGTAILITIMTTAAKDETIKSQVIGVNMSFFVTGIIALIGLVIAFMINDSKKKKVKLI